MRAGLVGEARCTWSHLLLLGRQERSPDFFPSPGTGAGLPLYYQYRDCAALPDRPARPSRASLYMASPRRGVLQRPASGKPYVSAIWVAPKEPPPPTLVTLTVPGPSSSMEDKAILILRRTGNYR
jgi:hypothetical protein